MGNIELLAIVLGALIILKRLPMLIWPDKTLGMLKKWSANTGNVKLIGTIMFLLGAFFIYLIWNEITLLQLLVGAISMIMLAFGFAYFLLPEMATTMTNVLWQKKGFLRTASIVGILIGLLLVYLGYSGL